MKTLVAPGAAEIRAKNSRFLAEAFPVAAQEDARAILKAQKERYPDASHVVHAFVIGPTGGILGCSDDGEPSGTAGRPALEVLKGSGITNVIVTVTRWFGGTLLGTGGLVSAYGDAVKAVLAAAKAEELVPMRGFSLEVPYELHERARRLLAELGAEVTREEFAVAVSLAGRVRAADAETLAARVTELSSGRVSVALSEDSPTARKT
jgi:uncharacterized YigZ family protein